MALTELTDEAIEGGYYPITVSFLDEDGDAVAPNANTIYWTLTDNKGTVINGRDYEAKASAASVVIELAGDDLAILAGETAEVVRRRLVVLWEYNSDLGNNKKGRTECIFRLRNLTRLPAVEA
jgi:hypothetical protein